MGVDMYTCSEFPLCTCYFAKLRRCNDWNLLFQSHILAARQIAHIISTSLGPKGLDKMMVSPDGKSINVSIRDWQNHHLFCFRRGNMHQRWCYHTENDGCWTWSSQIISAVVSISGWWNWLVICLFALTKLFLRSVPYFLGSQVGFLPSGAGKQN